MFSDVKYTGNEISDGYLIDHTFEIALSGDYVTWVAQCRAISYQPLARAGFPQAFQSFLRVSVTIRTLMKTKWIPELQNDQVSRLLRKSGTQFRRERL
jgi:hypothetical protein